MSNSDPRFPAASEGALLSNWLADYSHDLKEEGNFDQEATQLDKAAQWIADHLSAPAQSVGMREALLEAKATIEAYCLGAAPQTMARIDAALASQPSPAATAETKTVYVKRWRTLVNLPAKYADEIVEALRPHEQCSAGNGGEPVSLINRRLTDLAEANALYGKDQRLGAPDKVARNNREISWLKELRSIILTEPQGARK